ncbi:MAG: YihY/virulence factor BrkB family protein [candidate division Zixibacteria bacterium]|nr:YihY/virulence factor BrkB family protein [candidate division Zixibacteria bacterium]
MRKRSFVSFAKKSLRYLWRFIKGIYHKAEEHHLFLMSGGLSFSLLFCIIPLGLVIFAALGLVLEKTAIINEVGAMIDRGIPYPEFATFVKSVVLARAEEFKIYKNVAGVLGLVGLLLAATGLFSSMRTILNSVFRVKDGSRIHIDKLHDLGIMLLVLTYFLLSVAVVPLSDLLFSLADNVTFLGSFDLALLQRYLVQVVSIALILGSYLTIYSVIPRRRLGFRVVLIASLAATILWFTAKELFGLYIENRMNLQQIYGTYVMVVMIGLWIYYSSLVFILGAIIGQVYRELDKGTTHGEDVKFVKS